MTAYQQLQTRLSTEPCTWLITGVAGFIGSNLLETLLKLNQRVVGLDNFATGYQRNLDEVQTLVEPAQWANFSFIQGDIRNLADCQRAMTWSPVCHSEQSAATSRHGKQGTATSRHGEPSAATSRHCDQSVATFRHCEQSAAIHDPASSTMDRHGLQPRDDEKYAAIASPRSGIASPDSVIASEARQSMPPASIPVDYVLHQAALGSVPRSLEDPILTNSANITGYLNMLVAARDAKVKSFTYAASSSTYGDHPGLPKVEDTIGKPLSPYAVTKYVNELYADVFARSYGFNTVGLRYFNVFGPRQDPNGAYAAVIPKWTAALLQGEPVHINGDGETSRDFCFVANAVQANLLAATAESVIASPFSVIASEARQSTSPIPSTMDRHGLQPRDDEKSTVIASEARQSTSPTPSTMDRHGLQPRDDEKSTVIASEARQSMPPPQSPVNQVYNVAVGDRTTLNDLFVLLRDNLAAHGVGASTQPAYRDFRAGDVRHSQADIGKAQRLLGYAPTHSLADGITQAMPWYVAQNNESKQPLAQ